MEKYYKRNSKIKNAKTSKDYQDAERNTKIKGATQVFVNVSLVAITFFFSVYQITNQISQGTPNF